MSAIRLVLLAAASLTVAGCASPAQIRYVDDGRCRSYGFRPGTDAFASCLQNIDLDRSADRRELLARPYGGFGGFGYGVGFRRGWY